jgi:phosphate:Na+ symporter
MHAEINFVQIILELIGGLSLFLYGVFRMSQGLTAIAGDSMRARLASVENNVWAGLLTGLIATTLLDSSSLTIILLIGTINARLVSLRQALPVILGSNIGTTVSSQLIAFKVSEYGVIALLIGFFILLLAKTELLKSWGLTILSIGFVFFGLHTMDMAAEPLHGYKPFIDFLASLSHPYYGVPAGGLFTLVFQSSSATVGLAITLVSQNLMPLAGGVAVMMGAEIGTCSDTLFASIGGSKSAIRASVYHLLLNVLSVALGLLLFSPFVQFVEWASFGAGPARQLANGHMYFNTIGVLLALPFTRYASILLVRWIK